MAVSHCMSNSLSPPSGGGKSHIDLKERGALSEADAPSEPRKSKRLAGKSRRVRTRAGALPQPMARARRTRVSAPRGTAAATGASAGAASENNFTVPAVPPSSKLSALSDFLLPELVSLRLCAQRAARGLGDARSGAVRRGAERRGAVHT